MSGALVRALGLQGLASAPPQRFGEVAVVPLRRPGPPDELRLYRPGVTGAAQLAPHGYLLGMASPYQARVAYGSQIALPGQEFASATIVVERPLSLARPRMLSMNLDTEGFLYFFCGADAASWGEYARRLSARQYQGLRVKSAPVEQPAALADAARLFEPYEDQVGALVLLRDELAGALVVPHPEDYRALHPSLFDEVYDGFFGSYGLAPTPPPAHVLEPPGLTLRSVDDLRLALKQLKQRWANTTHGLSGGIAEQPLSFLAEQRRGEFLVRRFASQHAPTERGAIGELISRPSGRLVYLRLYTLTPPDQRRRDLLAELVRANWNMRAVAGARGETPWAYEGTLRRAGLGHLLRESFADARRTPVRSRPPSPKKRR